jgi:exopolysaccharide production protein ExoQ
MQIDNKVLNRWVKHLEVAFTIFWMLFFMGVNFPQPLGSLLKAISYPAIGILILVRWKRIPYTATRDPFLLFSVFIAILSLLWTGNLATTSEGIRGLLRTLLFAAYIASRYSLKDQMKLWIWIFSIILVLSFLVIICVPSYSIAEQGGWQGIFPYKNFLGYTMSLAVVLFLNHIISNKAKQNWLAFVGVAGAIALVILAKSSASLVSVLVLVSGMPLYQVVKQHYKFRVVIVGIIGILVSGIAFLIATNMDTILVNILGEGLSFNGRTPIWDLAIEKGLERPWLGYGFNAFWSSDAGIDIMVHTWSGLREEGFNTHNAFLEQFLSLGFIGLASSILGLFNIFARIIIVLLKTKKIELFWLFQLQLFTVLVSLADSYDTTLVALTITLTIGLEWSRINTYGSALNLNKNQAVLE